MEYLLSILGVLVAGLLCSLTIRYGTREKQAKNKTFGAGSSVVGEATSGVDPQTRKIREREFRKVPTPWGWPGHCRFGDDEGQPDLSRSMQLFTKRLLKQKQLVNGNSLDPRISGSIRALLEDRYAPSAKSIEYRKVKAPRLRDPNLPHDQMDSFGTREMRPDPNKLTRPDGMKTDLRRVAKTGRVNSKDLKDIKLPWGW